MSNGNMSMLRKRKEDTEIKEQPYSAGYDPAFPLFFCVHEGTIRQAGSLEDKEKDDQGETQPLRKRSPSSYSGNIVSGQRKM